MPFFKRGGGGEPAPPPSVLDPNTLNLDPDPGFWLNLDQDPGLYYQKEKF